MKPSVYMYLYYTHNMHVYTAHTHARTLAYMHARTHTYATDVAYNIHMFQKKSHDAILLIISGRIF